MRRGLAIAGGGVAGLVLLLMLGFQLWLRQQPPETRYAVEAMSLVEFASAVRHAFFHVPMPDNAGYGRVLAEGRGHAPWVMRSSLDGRPRMLSLALAPDLWLAYSTETASPHQLWRGALDFTGPAFDARHGAEPMSEGEAFFRAAAWTAWRVRGSRGWEPAAVQWIAYGVDAQSGRAWLRYAVRDAAGHGRQVRESPEWIAAEAGGGGALERRFEVEPGEAPEIAIQLPDGAGQLELSAGVTQRDGLLVLASGDSRVVHGFEAPAIAIARADGDALGDDPFVDQDCSTCHGARERIVGPAWGEIAARYRAAHRAATVEQLAARIVEGSSGRWGAAVMTPHPHLSSAEARALAVAILDHEQVALPSDAAPDETTPDATYDFDVEPRPESLHPSLRARPLEVEGFRPQVGGLAIHPDGRLLVSTWDRDGAVFLIGGWKDAGATPEVKRVAEGLHEPLGIAAAEGAVYVIQKQEITQLIDHDGDDRIDEYRALANDWRVTSNFHEFGFGLVPHDGALYASLSVCVLQGGKSCPEQTADRGSVVRVSLDTGRVTFVARGLRTPNGLATLADGSLLVTDNQGDWLPASKLLRVEPGADYGWRRPGEALATGDVTAPTLWLPQHEVGNSPTQPLEIRDGPYAGAILFGDIYNGGLKRAQLQRVGDGWQGAAFHFSGGLQAPVNRLIAAPDGTMVVGQVGSRGNWGEPDKQRYGIEVLAFEERAAFEPHTVEAVPGGFEIRFTRPLGNEVAPHPDHFALQQWRYVPTSRYGGPKVGLESLPVEAVSVSPDRETVTLRVPGLEAGRVVYLRIDRALRSAEDEPLWVNEAWYTMNQLPGGRAAGRPKPAQDTLSAEERAAGWRLLFDGRSFDGWKIYGAEDDAIEGWVIEEGALRFTRDVSFVGLVWNHLNPFTTAALDLMTKDRFSDFELSIEWKVAPGSNSGIFYLVPNEEARTSWSHALEMQVLDDERHSDGQLERRRAGDLYDLQASRVRVVRPAGQWNHARIRVEGDRVRHWMNGEPVVDLVRGSPEWNAAIAASKFDDVEGFGLAREGHIALQDHGDVVWYRNIKVRELRD